MRTQKIFHLSLGITLILVGLPWLFLITKESFLSQISTTHKFLVFLFVYVVYLIPILLASLLLSLLDSLVFPGKKFGLVYVLLAFLTGLAALYFSDTFLYVMFKYGLVKAIGLDRYIWTLGFCTIAIVAYRDIQKYLGEPQRIRLPKNSKLARPLIFIALPILIIFLVFFLPNKGKTDQETKSIDQNLPNIVLITVDGLNASHMSAFGYHRYTTPFLDSLAKRGLANGFHYTNSATTTGSITSILTGKLPTTTRVIYPPDILKGTDRFEHLPGILKKAGFYTAQFGVGSFVDANAINLIDGFDEVCGVQGLRSSFWERLLPNVPTEYFYFFSWLRSQHYEMLKHIAFLSTIEDEMDTVLEGSARNLQDSEKIESTIQLILSESQPVFSHIHLMGTHGAKFNPVSHVFSAWKDRKSQINWDNDLYDDSIVDVDNQIRSFVTHLDTSVPNEELFLIITSDHGQRWSVVRRMPLIIYYPDKVETKMLSVETQNLDIAPTILATIGIEIPEWMDGHNLQIIGDTRYPVISTGTSYATLTETGWTLDEKRIKPPFYQFSFLQVLQNSQWVRMNLQNGKISQGTVIIPCNEKKSVADWFDKQTYISTMIQQLQSDKYDFDPNIFKDK